MTTDEKVELAQKIAGKLVGITPSEWSKWCLYAQEKGLEKAIQLARVMQQSASLRPGPKQAYRTISQVIPAFQKELESLPPNALMEVLGYVRQAVIAR
ncbi:hypothetical protein [Thermoflexus hugenholtzii]|uniref:Uncharacterized protein n=1 Tax=Thermoflexus hugenholtzii JAD2 TaxID=877466 RepID=A0A212RMX4_9CHLR|nr:hypothetical protein [Thermoflexus hugenholtzii]SNB73762.1 hypothetical protein SAMN02746019_00019680 [Thermoflexus hugenholtzii JAD2]